MSILKPKPRKGQSCLISIVLGSDLWTVPVKAVLMRDGASFRILSGKVWRGATVQSKTVKVVGL